MSNLAGLALEGGDPRRPSIIKVGDKEIPVGGTAVGTGEKLHDSNVSFEEYLYHASISRADERYEELNPDYSIFGIKIKNNRHGNETLASTVLQVMGGEVSVPAPTDSKNLEATNGDHPAITEGEKPSETGSGPDTNRVAQYGVSDAELVQASRALRTAGWSAIFFLITTDILGPFNAPTAMAFMGYGPGIALYTVFGFLGAYGGFLLWKMFLALDSDMYPVKNYGDIPFRIYGTWARHLSSFLQFLQLLMNVAIIIAQNGLSLEQIIVGSNANPVCFVVLCLVWAIAGGLIGQIRTLRNIGWIANVSVWLNVFVMIVIMALVPRSPPLFEAATASNGPILGFGPYNASEPQIIQTFAGAPPGTGFNVQVQGLQLAIFAFGGATIFVELMAEMRRPFDFWKGLILSQIFIYGFYLFFGVFVYSFQGQFAINPAYQSISSYAWQTVGNSIELICSFIAALLYGNVGLKVAYNSVLRDIFGFPSLYTRGGKLLWVAMIPIFWAVAFVIGAAIPQITNLTSIVAAVCIIQFSYTFPPLFFVGYLVKRDAMLPGDGFNPTTGVVIRQDGGIKRIMRGFKKHWILNTWHVLYFLGSLVVCALGIYAAVLGLIASYAQGSQGSFSCHSIYNP